MPAKTLYVTNNLASVHQEMSETSPGADATSSPNYGWTVGAVAAGNYSKADSQVERATSTFATSPVEPDGSIDTTIGDCWRSTNAYSGTFDTGNWEFHLTVIAVTRGGTQDGNAGFRLFRGANADGTGATEITGARQEGSAVTNLLTSAQQDSTITVNISSFSLTSEYLFVQVGWETVGVGDKSSADVITRIGATASRVVTPNFTAASTRRVMVVS